MVAGKWGPVLFFFPSQGGWEEGWNGGARAEWHEDANLLHKSLYTCISGVKMVLDVSTCWGASPLCLSAWISCWFIVLFCSFLPYFQAVPNFVISPGTASETKTPVHPPDRAAVKRPNLPMTKHQAGVTLTIYMLVVKNASSQRNNTSIPPLQLILHIERTIKQESVTRSQWFATSTRLPLSSFVVIVMFCFALLLLATQKQL